MPVRKTRPANEHSLRLFNGVGRPGSDGERHPFDPQSAKWSARTSRDYGSFVKDTRDLGSWYNTEYSGTKMPVVESFHWLIVDGTIRLRGFQVHPNAEVRCGWRLSLGGQFFMLRSCDLTQLGPVPATPPM